jgi:uncharacterized protein YjbI with pentapeptide repeats
MLIERRDFDQDIDLPLSLIEDGIFRYCHFNGLHLEGPAFDAALVGCVLRDVEWYWGLFNCADILSTRFVNCVFLGSNFTGCRLIECTFEGCRFDLDNLGAPCGFRGCLLVETTFDQCQVVLENPHNHAVFEGNRTYGCTRVQCIGLDALF